MHICMPLLLGLTREQLDLGVAQSHSADGLENSDPTVECFLDTISLTQESEGPVFHCGRNCSALDSTASCVI